MGFLRFNTRLVIPGDPEVTVCPNDAPEWCPLQRPGSLTEESLLNQENKNKTYTEYTVFGSTSKRGLPPYASKHQGEGGCRNLGRGWVSCGVNARMPHDELLCFPSPNVPLSQTHVQSPWESCDRHKFEVPHMTLAWAYGQCTDIHPFLFWDSSGLLSSIILLVNEKYSYCLRSTHV